MERYQTETLSFKERAKYNTFQKYGDYGIYKGLTFIIDAVQFCIINENGELLPEAGWDRFLK